MADSDHLAPSSCYCLLVYGKPDGRWSQSAGPALTPWPLNIYKLNLIISDEISFREFPATTVVGM